MSFKKVLFVSILVLIIFLCSSSIIPNANAANVLHRKEVKMVKLSQSQGKIVSKIDRIFSLSNGVPFFYSIEKRAMIKDDNFFGLNKYFSRDGLSYNFPINRSLYLVTSLAPLRLERVAKLRLSHENRLAIFNSEVTLGFRGDYSLRLGLTRCF